MNVRKKKNLYNTRPIKQFSKSIIGLAQIFRRVKSDFYRLIIEMLNIYI